MINYNELEIALQHMQPRHKLYRIIKAEIERRGHWKAAPRGKVFQSGEDNRRKKLRPEQ